MANTDYDWYSHFLSRSDPPDEVNFWQPSPHGFRAIPPGAPFFFRLGAPRKAIAGYGFFARYGVAPAWLAWESFADLNGADSLAAMTDRIDSIRRRTGGVILERQSDYEVGCVMVSRPVFFAPEDWVRDHEEWSPRIQGGKTIDILTGDGQRILADCLARTMRADAQTDTLRVEVQRYGRPLLVEPRRPGPSRPRQRLPDRLAAHWSQGLVKVRGVV